MNSPSVALAGALALTCCLQITAKTIEDAETPEEMTMTATEAPIVERVGGDMDIAVEWKKDKYRCGRCRVSSPLPEAYPAPTPPGAIDIKRYPSVRRAEVSSDRQPGRSARNGAFWPLFNHIKKRDIAMTAPVEMDYRDWDQRDDAPGEWTMSFLYRTADLGPTGDDGVVEVVDAPALTVLSVGVQGPYGMRTVNAGLATLEAWLAQQDEWEPAGDPRSLSYNSPMVRDRDKWSEVQIPVRRVQVATAPTDES